MIENKDKDFIGKLKQRAERSLKVEEVNLNSQLYIEAINYLREQKYLKFEEIIKVIKNSFLANYPLGYIIKNHKNNIVGFMGTIFSKKIHDNREHTYCNIHSWVVDKSYRINSFFLLIPIIKKKIILTAFTPVKSLVGLLEKFDFKNTKIYYRVVCNFNFFILRKKNNYIIEKNSSVVKEMLNQTDLKIYNSYYQLPYEKFMIVNKIDSSKNIFIISSIIKKKGINILNFFYISSTSEFKKNWHQFKSIISKEFRVNFFSQYFFDDLNNAFPLNILLSKTKEKDIFVKDIPPNVKLDILYSDLIE